MADDAVVTVNKTMVRDYLGGGQMALKDMVSCSERLAGARGSVAAPPIAFAAELALKEALGMIVDAYGMLRQVWQDHHDNVDQAMRQYTSLDDAGHERIGAISARLGDADPHSYLASQQNQVSERLAEVG